MLLTLERLRAILQSSLLLFRERNNARFPSILRKEFEQLGASFIKLGQTMSMRPDFLPIRLCTELEKCLDDMPAVPFQDIAEVIRDELGKSPHELFRHFSKTPVASASIAQVHMAQLHSGEKVAVKVLKPGVEALMKTDLRILTIVGFFIDVLHVIPTVKMKTILQEYRRFSEEEMDFRKEANYIHLIAEHEEAHARCPKIYEDLSGRRVLTLEWLKGTTVSALIEMKRGGRLEKWLGERGLDLEKMIVDIMETGMQQPLLGGFFHGDLHPSNILVGDDGEIQWIDFGICGYLDDSLRYNYFYFLLSLAHDDAAGCVFFMEKCCEGHIKPSYDRQRYRAEISKLIDEFKGQAASEFSQGELIQRIIRTSAQAGLDVPLPLILVTRSTLAMDGIVQKLYPQWIWAEHTEKLFRKIYRHHMRKKFRRNKFLYEIDRSFDTVTQMPELVDRVLRKQGGNASEELRTTAVLDG